MPLPLRGGIGILGGVDHGLGRRLVEIEAHDGPRPLGEVELLGVRREHLLVGIAAPSLGEIESEDAIGLGRVDLYGPDEIGDGGDEEALVEASEAAIVKGERIVGIDLDRFAEVLDGQGIVFLEMIGAAAIVVGESGAGIQANGLVVVLDRPIVVAHVLKGAAAVVVGQG